MKAGIIDLKQIFDYAKENPEIPKGRGGFSGYSKVCEEVLSRVPEHGGWYFWGAMKNGEWKHIYIGMAGARVRKLHYRIKEELKDERAVFWADARGREKAIESHRRQYGGKYEYELQRALEKTGTKYIIWVSDSSASPKEIRDTESFLIHYYRPTANRDHRGNKEKTNTARKVKTLFENVLQKSIQNKSIEK